MRIMGVDLSVTCTGIAFPAGETMAVMGRGRGDERRFRLVEHVEIAVRACKADLVVIEGLGGVYRGEAAREIPMLHGAVRLALRRIQVPFMTGVSPRTLKLFATGNGNASKTTLRVAAKRLLGASYDTDDECDADWLRVAGMTAYGVPVRTPGGGRLTMPDGQVLALRVTRAGKPVEWPVVGGRSAWVHPQAA